MPDTRRIEVFYEGDDDAAMLRGLQDISLLPTGCEIARRDKQKYLGREGLFRQLIPFIRPDNGVAGSAIVLLDLDDLAADQLSEWFLQQLTAGLKPDGLIPNRSAPVATGTVVFAVAKGEHTGRVALVGVGRGQGIDFKLSD